MMDQSAIPHNGTRKQQKRQQRQHQQQQQQYHHQQQQQDQPRANFTGLRMRSDSTGSVRGAFGASPVKENKPLRVNEDKSNGLRNRRKAKNTDRANGNHGTMANVADLAVASLSNEDPNNAFEDPGLAQGSRLQAPPKRRPPMEHTPMPESVGVPTYGAVLPEHGHVPPKVLETIRDDSSSTVEGSAERGQAAGASRSQQQFPQRQQGSQRPYTGSDSFAYSDDGSSERGRQAPASRSHQYLPHQATAGQPYAVSDSLAYSDWSQMSFDINRLSQREASMRSVDPYAAVGPHGHRESERSVYGTTYLESNSSLNRALGASATSQSSAFRQSPRGAAPSYQAMAGAPPPAPPPYQNRKQEIAAFSSLVHGDYRTSPQVTDSTKQTSVDNMSTEPIPSFEEHSEYRVDDTYLDDDDDSSFDEEYNRRCFDKIIHLLDPTTWLLRDALMDEDGTLYFADSSACTMAGLARYLLWNPINPEFTSLQQICWAVIIGIAMGAYTAFWKFCIESGLDFVWETVPETLLQIGLFTDLKGAFPLYHYMWICPAIFGGALSTIFVLLPIKIPGQNEWIDNLHMRGVQDYRTFWTLFVLSTVGMWSGLSLGPELPLVLTAGMAGSWLGLACKQSMLQARIMNLTCASAAIGGFFGFPMAGALFVLELPHRMGLQYFEALSPATLASIIAVLANRMLTGNDVTGYFSYPFLTLSLPSEIFTSAIVYGLFGAAIGIGYSNLTIVLKAFVHDLFHKPHDHGHEASNHSEKVAVDDGDHPDEKKPLMSNGSKSLVKKKPSIMERMKAVFCFVIPNEAVRAGVSGTLAGMGVGVISMFFPHVVFWGEAQLQNLIDRGRTPLPFFGGGHESTSAMVALGRCMIDPSDPAAVEEGFSVGCAAMISIAKTIVVGLSLGTGIVGGHFWGPLFVGCSCAHFLIDVVGWFADHFGFGRSLAEYPCVVILCTMGAAHVVPFRAHLSIMLILTLTISAFNPEDGENSTVAGDYSAVFPLLVVSVFVSLMVSRQTVFYKSQRNRGDITAVPEVLCEPGMEGTPMVVDYYAGDNGSSFDGDSAGGSSSGSHSDVEHARSGRGSSSKVRKVENSITQSDIERAFEQTNSAHSRQSSQSQTSMPEDGYQTHQRRMSYDATITSSNDASPPKSSARLDELLSKPIESEKPKRLSPPRSHRRTQSAPVRDFKTVPGSIDIAQKQNAERARLDSFTAGAPNRERRNSGSSRGSLVRISSFGELQEQQPSLVEQAQMRSANAAAVSRHNRIPSFRSGRHSRKNSESSALSASAPPAVPLDSGALTMDDIDHSFNTVLNKTVSGVAFGGRSLWTNNSSSDGTSPP